jgi:uncharacterized membrane protein YraQ (UPF0718 family)/YHS domain-containing protein
VSDVLQTVWEGISNGLLMAWEVWWALVLGFAISAIVQAWVPSERIERSLGGGSARPVTLAAVFGAASSSCSYAAIAIARSLFAKGASAASALAFQFASTNLVFELGLVIWILIGWQFTLAELIGGVILIAAMTLLLRLFVSRRAEEIGREHAQSATSGHEHRSVGSSLPLRRRLVEVDAWSDVAHNFRNDWSMVWKEVALGFLIAGFLGLLGNGFYEALFIHDAPEPWRLIENVLVGPLVAILSFVCSVGNVPLAAVLWSGGIAFAGVIAFLFADLIVLPIVLIYRKYYGWNFTVRITTLMFVTIVLAALAVDGLFSLAGLIPHTRPTRSEIFGGVHADYKLVANVLATLAFAVLFGLTYRRGVRDPACGMTVDRRRAVTLHEGERTLYFCSEHCRQEYEGSGRHPAAV